MYEPIINLSMFYPMVYDAGRVDSVCLSMQINFFMKEEYRSPGELREVQSRIDVHCIGAHLPLKLFEMCLMFVLCSRLVFIHY